MKRKPFYKLKNYNIDNAYIKKYDTKKVTSFVIKKFHKRPRFFDIVLLLFFVIAVNHSYFYDVYFNLKIFIKDNVSKLSLVNKIENYVNNLEYKKKFSELYTEHELLKMRMMHLMTYENDIAQLKSLLKIKNNIKYNIDLQSSSATRHIKDTLKVSEKALSIKVDDTAESRAKVDCKVDIKFANVVSFVNNDYGNYFIIDIGKSHGVVQDSFVIYDNCLVGKVRNVYNQTSDVVLVTDNNCFFSSVLISANDFQNVHDILYAEKNDNSNAICNLDYNDAIKGIDIINPQQIETNASKLYKNAKLSQENDNESQNYQRNTANCTEQNNAHVIEQKKNRHCYNSIQENHAIVSGCAQDYLRLFSKKHDFDVKTGDVVLSDLYKFKIGSVHKKGHEFIIKPFLNFHKIKYVCVIC